MGAHLEKPKQGVDKEVDDLAKDQASVLTSDLCKCICSNPTRMVMEFDQDQLHSESARPRPSPRHAQNFSPYDQQHPPLLRPSYSHARIPLQSNTSSLTHPAAVPKEYDYEVAKYLREKLHTEATIKLTEGETEIARITNRQLEVRRLLRMPNDGGEQDVHIRHKLQLEKDCLETALLIEQRKVSFHGTRGNQPTVRIPGHRNEEMSGKVMAERQRIEAQREQERVALVAAKKKKTLSKLHKLGSGKAGSF
eukprot:CAMPEP_0173114772 /NCGR_PEP_ID=MMETSP1102-20130122/47918_1 /TAXON_ID=49646 /ORGANISM="Geminigera sp., Strain Caron Lab Isolate" /LENGTH=250 /DNA_ID=CAMNT_0014017309 /DNA_START=95 /DNA_END=847 /DNA_ORIENTATION=+